MKGIFLGDEVKGTGKGGKGREEKGQSWEKEREREERTRGKTVTKDKTQKTCTCLGYLYHIFDFFSLKVQSKFFMECCEQTCLNQVLLL